MIHHFAAFGTLQRLSISGLAGNINVRIVTLSRDVYRRDLYALADASRRVTLVSSMLSRGRAEIIVLLVSRFTVQQTWYRQDQPRAVQ